MWVVLWQGCSVHPSFPGGSVILHKEQAPGGIAGTGSLNHNPGTQERLMMLQVLLYTNQKHTKKPYNLIKRKSISSLFFLFFFFPSEIYLYVIILLFSTRVYPHNTVTGIALGRLLPFNAKTDAFQDILAGRASRGAPWVGLHNLLKSFIPPKKTHAGSTRPFPAPGRSLTS